MKTKITFFLLLFGFLSFSQTYVPDPTFGGTGIIKFFNNTFRPQQAMLVNNNYFFLSDQGNQLVKVNYDGEYVSNFGQWGTITFGQPGNLATISGFLHHDNYFYLYGSIDSSNNKDLYVVKIDQNGNYDTNFGLNGLARIDLGQNEFISDLNVESDGTLFCIGTKSTSVAYSSRLIYFKINAGGTINTTFDANGYKEYQMNASTNGFKILNYNNKKLLVGQTNITQTNNSHPELLLLSVDADGVLDPLYGANGRETYSYGGGTFSVGLRDVQVFNNKLYISYYYAESFNYQFSRFLIYDIPTDQGTTPSIPSQYLTFTVGNDGLFSTRWCSRCCLQSSNCGGDTFNIWKWNLNGTADSSFHINGSYNYSIASSTNPLITSLNSCQSFVFIKEPGGKFLLGGYSGNASQSNLNGFTLMRLVEQGALGTNEMESVADRVYPNPFDDQINITSDKPFKTIEVYDLTGRKIASPNQQFNNGTVAINLSAISQTGTYVIKMITVDNNVIVKRIIKK